MASTATRTAGVAGTFTYTLKQAPFSAPQLTIYSDAARTQAAVASAPTVATANPLVFTCNYPASLAAGTYYLSFSTVFQSGQTAMVDANDTLILATQDGDIGSTYATIQQLRDFGITTTQADDAHAADYLEMASRIVEDYTGNLFYQTVQTVVISDVRTPLVRVPLRPFSNITAVVINATNGQGGSTIANTGYIVEPWGLRLYIPGFLDIDGYPPTTMTQLAAGYRGFDAPYGSEVSITATFGYPTVPSPVRQATVLIAARLVEMIGEQLLDPNIVSLSVEGYRLMLDRGTQENPLDTTGVVAADRLLARYRPAGLLVG